ncbi:MAG: sigma-70 family RNA polymerase sigma factor [Planctomycetales bacterium]|nr:sigma-70 family RNA polymerase sigma factor [Planctomycetales bacterium]
MSEELIKAAKQGDRVSLERLLLAAYPRILRHVQIKQPTILKGKVGPDDLVQQTFTQAFLKIHTFAGDTEPSLMKWLRVIADRQLQDAVKALNRKKRGGDRKRVTAGADDSRLQLLDILAGNESTASRQLSRKESMQALHVAIAELPEDYRLVILLRYFEGLSLAEISEELGRSEGAVRGLLDRARVKLRDAMGRASQWLQ